MTDHRKLRGLSDAAPAKFDAEKPAEKPKGLSLKVRRIGNSLGVVLPKEVLAKLRVGEGDQLRVAEAAEGGVRLVADDGDTAALMKLAEGVMQKRRKVLKALAQ